MLLLFSGCRALAQPVPEPALYQPTIGPLAITTCADLRLHDPARNTDLPLTAVFPTAEGRYPVIVWSHGFRGSPRAYVTYGQHWASAGYVVLMPVHRDSGARHGHEEGLPPSSSVVQLMHDPAQWIDRLQDLTLLLDSLPELQKQAPAELADKLGVANLGLGGHSFGAYTALAIGGATLVLPGETQPRSYADPRVKALIAMSPTVPGQMGLTQSSYQHLGLPMLTMTGSYDFSFSGLGPEAKRLAFALSPPGDKHHLFLEGAGHLAFNDVPGRLRSPERAAELEQHDRRLSWADNTALAFWDAYLKADPQAQAWLHSEALAQVSRGQARLERR